MEPDDFQAFPDSDMSFVGIVGFLEPTPDNEIAEMLLQQLGAEH